MVNLLSDVKVPKTITDPKKNKKTIKKPKEDGLKVTILGESDKESVNKFIEAFNKNPYNARVKFISNYGKGYSVDNTNTSFTRFVLFEHINGDFEICDFKVIYNISKTCKLFSYQKKIKCLIYKDNKFYFTETKRNNKKIIRLLDMVLLRYFMNSFSELDEANRVNFHEMLIYKFFKEKFSWVDVLRNHEISWGIPFNSVVRKKLFGAKAINRHLFKVRWDIAEIVINSKLLENHYLKTINKRGGTKAWCDILKQLTYTDNITEEFLKSQYFIDTVNMGITLNRKVNCRWGLKRLKSEHDEWAKDINNILLDFQDEYELNIDDIFVKFADYSGFKLLKTNKEMLLEGMNQHHCVGTYINSVNRGDSGIYHINGYTLELVNEIPYSFDINQSHPFGFLKIKQFRGLRNEEAPEERHKMVNDKIMGFDAALSLIDVKTVENDR